MNNFSVIDDEIVPVYETDKGEKIVDGRELHGVLESKQDFSTWVKKRLAECDATENTDYELLHNSVEQVSGTKYRIDYIIKLDTAKEMAMLERNEIGKKVRKHFIEIENRYKQHAIDRAQLSPQTQALMALTESIARTELEQKRQAEQIQRLEDTQHTLVETFQNTSGTEDFQAWANKCLCKIAQSPKFDRGYGRNNNYGFAKNESYERLKKKWNCNLNDRVARAKGRAMEKNPGITKAQLNAINKLTVISADKSLRPVYETVIKEMMIAYCVEK